jgi:hypothetical protein
MHGNSTMSPPKTVKREGKGGRGVKKEEHRWGKFDQSTLCAYCKYHNDTPLPN